MRPTINPHTGQAVILTREAPTFGLFAGTKENFKTPPQWRVVWQVSINEAVDRIHKFIDQDRMESRWVECAGARWLDFAWKERAA